MEKVELNQYSFVIDRANAKAMIEGFSKEGKNMHQCIYCYQKYNFMNKTKLITLSQNNTYRAHLSSIGVNLNADNYTINKKFVARYVDSLPIKWDSNIWEIICHNGLFDIWKPSGPYERYRDSSPKNHHRDIVLFLRVYEIAEEFLEDELLVKQHGKGNERGHFINRENRVVTLVRPVISDEEFEQIRLILMQSTREYSQTRYEPKMHPVIRTINRKPVGHNHTLSESAIENLTTGSLGSIEQGLKLIGKQYNIPVGRIDLFCEDCEGKPVVIEMKKWNAPTNTIVDQITLYMGYVQDKIAKEGQKVRGIIIVGEKDEKLEYKCRMIPNLTVKVFNLSFS